MKVGKILDVRTRREWRSWLAKNHRSAQEIWVVYYRKDSGIKGIAYNECVEEALCYGWIDSTTKSRDGKSWLQRYTPRRPKSVLSELNKERMRKMIAAGKMTKAGLDSVAHHLTGKSRMPKRFAFPKDILEEIKKNPLAWKHYRTYTPVYRSIRIAWIDDARDRPDEFRKRLKYFIAMTEKNKQFGTIKA